MADATPTTPVTETPHSIRTDLIAELKAIKDRVIKAARDEEKQVLASQFAQRIEHLVERIENIGRDAGVGPDAKATDPEAGE